MLDLLRTAKLLFPNATIHCQSLLPLPIYQRPFIVDDILEMNNVIFESCVRQKCYYVDVMSATLDLSTGERDTNIFKSGKISILTPEDMES